MEIVEVLQGKMYKKKKFKSTPKDLQGVLSRWRVRDILRRFPSFSTFRSDLWSIVEPVDTHNIRHLLSTKAYQLSNGPTCHGNVLDVDQSLDPSSELGLSTRS
jgi:hypothetical protein